ncbi:hypothetical protein [Mycolicibacter arupensis]|jgi:hypothetical protein|uniref:Holin n=1 Tax=Mycolicibacter arupensis TaxID=342002 RepID=A0A0F5MVJ9_9MYCO|nr:hypothetical protein [Mycolicibacter arupensis]KKB98833.1 hypothetical protein WR43_12580 [Mycolicibacter arupensis]MCV7277111.1 hypothetical protein [Mycolicibacter arupensis]OQZ94762.1 hypothetical protein BST15_15720 [Mycolicibacter arupensis]TXI54424.1 MAG: hypothetical protein E6Q54_14565 [Mycolicibacter arupensis]
MSTESESEAELYTLRFWKRSFAISVSTAAATASSVLANTQAGSLHDVPWYGTLSTALLSGLIVLFGLIGGAGIRDAVPGDVTTREALATLSTGRHAKPDDGNELGA